jgi:uncharacterized glyoxalase superfamily protein PhnB
LIENRSVPNATVIPLVAYPDVVEATDWLCDAFGFEVRLRIGSHRAQLVFGDGAVIVTQSAGALTPQSIHVRVEDAERHHHQAARSGATIVMEPADYPFGERQYTAEDPGGHRWTFSESTSDVDPASWGATSINI